MEIRRTLTYYLTHQNDVLPHLFTFEIKSLQALASSKGLVLLSLKDLCNKLYIEAKTYHKEFYADLIKLLSCYDLAPIPFYIPNPIDENTQIYIVQKPNLYNDKDCTVIKALKEQNQIAKRDLPKLKYALYKIQNYNILLRVFEALHTICKAKLNVYLRARLDNIINDMPLPAEGAIFIRRCFTFAAEIASYPCEFNDEKYCLSQLNPEQHKQFINIMALLAASLPYYAKIDENYPFREEIKNAYLKLKPNALELKTYEEINSQIPENAGSRKTRFKIFNFTKYYSDLNSDKNENNVAEKKTNLASIHDKNEQSSFTKGIDEFYRLNRQIILNTKQFYKENKNPEQALNICTLEGGFINKDNLALFIKNKNLASLIPNPHLISALSIGKTNKILAQSSSLKDVEHFDALVFNPSPHDDQFKIHELLNDKLQLESNDTLCNYALNFSSFYLLVLKPLFSGYNKKDYQDLEINFLNSFNLELNDESSLYPQSLALSYLFFRFNADNKDYLNEDFVLSFIYCPELLSLLCHKILKSYDNNFDSLPDHLKDLFYIAPALKYLSKNLQLFHPDSYVELVKFLYRYLKQNTQNGTFKEALQYTLTISIKDNDYLSLKNSLIKHGFLHHDSLTEIGKIFADLLFNEIKDNKKLISSVSSQSITRFFKKREKLFVDLFKDPNNKICTAIRRLLINDESFNDLSIIANWLNYAKTPHKALISVFAKERYNIKELEELTEKILIKGNFICFPAITDYSNKNRFIFSTPFNHSTSVLTVLKPKPNRFNPLFIEKIKSLQCAYHLICCVNFNQSANEDIDKILSCTDFDSVQERSLAKTYLKTFKNYLKLYNPNPQIDLKALKTFYKNDDSIVNTPDFYEILLRYAQKELLRYRFSPFFTHKLQLILDAVRIDTKTVLSSNENSKDNNDFNHLNKAIIDSKLQESVQVREVIGQIKAQNEENIDSEFSPEDVSSTVNKNDNIAIEKDIAAVTAPSEINETNTDQIDKALLHLIKGVHSQQRDLMDIKEFEGLCLSSGFMSLDAAVEIANEYGYDNFDEPLFELAPEENCVYITEDLLTRICSRYA